MVIEQPIISNRHETNLTSRQKKGCLKTRSGQFNFSFNQFDFEEIIFLFQGYFWNSDQTFWKKIPRILDLFLPVFRTNLIFHLFLLDTIGCMSTLKDPPFREWHVRFTSVPFKPLVPLLKNKWDILIFLWKIDHFQLQDLLYLSFCYTYKGLQGTVVNWTY